MIAGMASAFSVGQPAGQRVVRADGGFPEALAVASVLLTVSAWVVRR
jgi:hypothetical protein